MTMPIDQQTLRKSVTCALIIAAFFVALVLLAVLISTPPTGVSMPSWVASWVAALFIGALAALIIGMVACGYFDLTKLISESDGTASMARFQLLIFTFVIGGGLLVVILAKTALDFTISNQVLGLLGISGGGYLGAKITQRATEPSITQAKAKASAGGGDTPVG